MYKNWLTVKSESVIINPQSIVTNSGRSRLTAVDACYAAVDVCYVAVDACYAAVNPGDLPAEFSEISSVAVIRSLISKLFPAIH